MTGTRSMIPFLFALGPGALAGGLPAHAGVRELRVCGTCAIRNLDEAVRAAAPGDRIVVEAGTYAVSGLRIDKRLDLTGQGHPVLDGGGRGTLLRIAADGVRLTGFTLRNTGTSYVEDVAAIRAEEVKDCVLESNRVKQSFFGIYLARTEGCTVRNNVVDGPRWAESASGNAIHIWTARGATVVANTVTGHRDGIYFEFVSDSRIVGNQSHDNYRYGLHFMFSNGNEYRDNVFDSNGAGVAVMYSTRIRMIRNRFARSWGGSAYGMLLKDISASEIDANEFIANTVGIYMEGSSRSVLRGNEFRSNGAAVRIYSDSEDNRFEGNNFTGNSFDVTTNGTRSASTFDGNYWSAYQGVDLDHDGRGDYPFRPVRLSSMLMDRYGMSYLLLRSFFFTLVDQAEAAFPVLTPELLWDRHPLMKPALKPDERDAR